MISQRMLQRLYAYSVSGNPLGCGFLISIENLLCVKQKCEFFFVFFFFYPLLILRIKRNLRSLFSTNSLIILCFTPFLSCAFPFVLLLPKTMIVTRAVVLSEGSPWGYYWDFWFAVLLCIESLHIGRRIKEAITFASCISSLS